MESYQIRYEETEGRAAFIFNVNKDWSTSFFFLRHDFSLDERCGLSDIIKALCVVLICSLDTRECYAIFTP